MCVEIRHPRGEQTFNAGTENFDEYAPVDENGTVWGPRTLEQAQDAMRAWPKGGMYNALECTCSDSHRVKYGKGHHHNDCQMSTPYAGVTHILKRTVNVQYGPWREVDSKQLAPR